MILDYLHGELEEAQASGDSIEIAVWEVAIAEHLDEEEPKIVCPSCNANKLIPMAGITRCLYCGNQLDDNLQPIDGPNYLPEGYPDGLIGRDTTVAQHLINLKLAEAEEAEA